ncbi:stigma-specific STIG1-like protein 1 [Abrus precatorius]|uniref:Stigma-specific STIG1-like protein 1 n=1 Tax=Abrus precatorius TaxID=3816 RepID=A0A8B8K734_ABRPR|nr:stigma-specific STIG1-like protein 1 [Abrus precatorius]
MKSLLILFLLAVLLALVIADSETQHKEELPKELTSLRGAKGLHGHKYGRGFMTCDKYPRVCRVKGSQGPDCCRKKCVNVSTDRNNCGKCGKKCKYSQMCCRGKCINPMFDKHHCGGCGNKCSKGNFCVYGMCSYA